MKLVDRGELDVLAGFQVEGVEPCPNGDLLLTGAFEGDPGDSPDWLWLWLRDGSAITAMRERRDNTTLVRVSAADRRAPIEAGDRIPWLRAYWQAYHVPMILQGDWERRRFIPRDAVHYREGTVRGWAPIEGGAPRDAVVTGIEVGGWDHEHCEICGDAVGKGGVEVGFVDPDDHWLCPSCYERWAEPRDLGFLIG